MTARAIILDVCSIVSQHEEAHVWLASCELLVALLADSSSRRALQVPSASFNAAQLAVIGNDGQLPKLDLAFLLRFYAESHVGIPANLQVLFQPGF